MQVLCYVCMILLFVMTLCDSTMRKCRNSGEMLLQAVQTFVCHFHLSTVKGTLPWRVIMELLSSCHVTSAIYSGALCHFIRTLNTYMIFDISTMCMHLFFTYIVLQCGITLEYNPFRPRFFFLTCALCTL